MAWPHTGPAQHPSYAWQLCRYQYDPNLRVRDAMAYIWRALVPEPRKALEAHFDAVAAELLREMTGRLWRSREAACAALADLLQVTLIVGM